MEFKAYPRSIVARPKAKPSPADKELNRYDEYMDHVRGLAPKTRSMALRVVGRLLTSLFGDGPINIFAIKPARISRLFVEPVKRYSNPARAPEPSWHCCMVTLATVRREAMQCMGWRPVPPRQLAPVIAVHDKQPPRFHSA